MRLFPNSLNHHPGLWGMKKNSGCVCIYGWVFNGVSEVQGLKMFFGISWKSKALSHYIKELNSLAMGLYKYFLLPFVFREVGNLKRPGPPNHRVPRPSPRLGVPLGCLLVPGWDAQGTDWGGWNQGCSDFILSWNSRFFSEWVPSQKPAAQLRGLPWKEGIPVGWEEKQAQIWDASCDSEPLPRADIIPALPPHCEHSPGFLCLHTLLAGEKHGLPCSVQAHTARKVTTVLCRPQEKYMN